MTASTGVYQYSCAATCTAGSSSGVTTECCYASINCNSIHQVTSCYVGTDATAAITSCSGVYCKVNKKDFFDHQMKRIVKNSYIYELLLYFPVFF